MEFVFLLFLSIFQSVEKFTVRVCLASQRMKKFWGYLRWYNDARQKSISTLYLSYFLEIVIHYIMIILILDCISTALSKFKQESLSFSLINVLFWRRDLICEEAWKLFFTSRAARTFQVSRRARPKRALKAWEDW